jgi:hypothetical protein
MLKDQLTRELRQRDQYLSRSNRTDNDINDLHTILDGSLSKLARNPDIDPILLEHETRKLDAAVEMKRSSSPHARLSPSPVRHQSPTRAAPTARVTGPPVSVTRSAAHPHRPTPNPVPLRSTLRK